MKQSSSMLPLTKNESIWSSLQHCIVLRAVRRDAAGITMRDSITTILRIIGLFILLAGQLTLARAQFICMSDQEYVYPVFARRISRSASFSVSFQVDEFQPKDIHIEPLDSSNRQDIEMFRDAIVSNLNLVQFLKDSNGVTFIIRFKMLPAFGLSSPYAELRSNNEIVLCSGLWRADLSIDGTVAVRKPDPNIDTVVVEANVEYRLGKAPPANILVQRIFDNDSGKTRIVRNNYPNLEQDIYDVARKFAQEGFLNIGPNARFYFVRFHVIRHTKCRYLEQIF